MNNKDLVVLHPYVKSRKKLKKVFVFDFDETLGSFGHLYYLWEAIQMTIGNRASTELFQSVADLYPEFLRHGIVIMLEFLYFKKSQGKCDTIFIYTNNQCINNWVRMVVQYIESKIIPVGGDPLFDKIIHAFKINNQIVERDRTTQRKTYDDFIRCSVIPKNTEICFVDDSFHPSMIHNHRVYYIQPRAYLHDLDKKTILSRLFRDNILGLDNLGLDNLGLDNCDEQQIRKLFLSVEIQDCVKTEKEKRNDILISKRMMYYIKEFFYTVSHSSTQKKNTRIGKITRKAHTPPCKRRRKREHVLPPEVEIM
jgi:hypothetical protein